jgi:hypothetical protein
MLEVKREMQVAASPDAVWAVIRDFGGIADWHPACSASSSETVGSDIHRTIVVGDGGRIVEKLEGQTDSSYSYSVISGPLPVQDYLSTLSVEASEGGSTIHWSGRFNAKGVPDEKAREVIGGIYDLGLGALKKKFG